MFPRLWLLAVRLLFFLFWLPVIMRSKIDKFKSFGFFADNDCLPFLKVLFIVVQYLLLYAVDEFLIGALGSLQSVESFDFKQLITLTPDT